MRQNTHSNPKLLNRKQRARIDKTVSQWRQSNVGVPQGSILGPLLCNIFIDDIFSFLKFTEITNYADDKTPYICCEKLQDTFEGHEYDSEILRKFLPTSVCII